MTRLVTARESSSSSSSSSRWQRSSNEFAFATIFVMGMNVITLLVTRSVPYIVSNESALHATGQVGALSIALVIMWVVLLRSPVSCSATLADRCGKLWRSLGVQVQLSVWALAFVGSYCFPLLRLLVVSFLTFQALEIPSTYHEGSAECDSSENVALERVNLVDVPIVPNIPMAESRKQLSQQAFTSSLAKLDIHNGQASGQSTVVHRVAPQIHPSPPQQLPPNRSLRPDFPTISSFNSLQSAHSSSSSSQKTEELQIESSVSRKRKLSSTEDQLVLDPVKRLLRTPVVVKASQFVPSRSAIKRKAIDRALQMTPAETQLWSQQLADYLQEAESLPTKRAKAVSFSLESTALPARTSVGSNNSTERIPIIELHTVAATKSQALSFGEAAAPVPTLMLPSQSRAVSHSELDASQSTKENTSVSDNTASLSTTASSSTSSSNSQSSFSFEVDKGSDLKAPSAINGKPMKGKPPTPHSPHNANKPIPFGIAFASKNDGADAVSSSAIPRSNAVPVSTAVAAEQSSASSTAVPNPSTSSSTFTFGSSVNSTATAGAGDGAGATAAVPKPFVFGATADSSSASDPPKFALGSTANATSSVPSFSFGASNPTAPTAPFTFGSSSAAPSSTAAAMSGQSLEKATNSGSSSSFVFGAANAAADAQLTSVPAVAVTSSSAFTFGASTSAVSAPSFGAATIPPPTISFGSSQNSLAAFGSSSGPFNPVFESASGNSSAPSPIPGPVSGSFSFGSSISAPAPSFPTANPFGPPGPSPPAFGMEASASTSGFSLGTSSAVGSGGTAGRRRVRMPPRK